jgi:hypothetical protein
LWQTILDKIWIDHFFFSLILWLRESCMWQLFVKYFRCIDTIRFLLVYMRLSLSMSLLISIRCFTTMTWIVVCLEQQWLIPFVSYVLTLSTSTNDNIDDRLIMSFVERWKYYQSELTTFTYVSRAATNSNLFENKKEKKNYSIFMQFNEQRCYTRTYIN